MKIVNILFGTLLIILTLAEGIVSSQIAELTETTEAFLLIIGVLGIVLIWRAYSAKTALIRLGNYLLMLMAVLFIYFYYTNQL